MSNNTDSRLRSSINRRQILGAATGAIATSVAGCLSGDDDDDIDDDPFDDSNGNGDDSTGNGSGNLVRDTLNMPITSAWNTPGSNVNPLSTTSEGPWWVNYIWREPLSYPISGEPWYYALEGVEVNDEGCEIELTFRDDFTWWNGTPVTAEDYYVWSQIDQYEVYGSPDNAPHELVFEDDHTLRQIRSEPINPDLAGYEFEVALTLPRDYMQPWLEQFEDATSDEEIDDVTAEIDNTTITIEEMVDEGLGCGLWIPESWDETEVVHRKHEDHPRADWTNLEHLRWVIHGDEQVAQQAMNNGEYDIGEEFINRVDDVDSVENFNQFDISGMPKLCFNFRNEHLANRAVRQAIAYLIDHEEITEVVYASDGLLGSAPDHFVGMNTPSAENWFDDEFLDDLIPYGATAQPDKAEEVLRNAGYERDGDTWVSSDGSAIEDLRYTSPQWQGYTTMATLISSRLNEFGIQTELYMDSATGFNERFNETFEFDLAHWFLNGTRPDTAYATGRPAGLDDFTPSIESQPSTGEGCVAEFEPPALADDRTERFHQPVRPEFPAEVGDDAFDGEAETLYPIMWNDEMTQTPDEERLLELGEKLAWYYNWQVPHVPFYEEEWVHWGNTEEFEMPDGSHHEHGNPEPAFLTKGHIDSRTE